MKGQNKAGDFRSRSLIWSWLDRGFELSGPVPKKHLGKLVGLKTHVCTFTEQFVLRFLLSASCWIVLGLVTLCFHQPISLNQRKILMRHLLHSDFSSPSFILNPYVFISNALLENLHNLIFTHFSKRFCYFLLFFSELATFLMNSLSSWQHNLPHLLSSACTNP